MFGYNYKNICFIVVGISIKLYGFIACTITIRYMITIHITVSLVFVAGLRHSLAKSVQTFLRCI